MESGKIFPFFVLSFCYILGEAANDTDIIPESRIVHGEIAGRTAVPYHIMVRRNGEYICGGAFVRVEEIDIVLTAASCVEDRDGNYDVVAGAHHRTEFDSNVQIHRVTVIIRHHGYNRNQMPSKDDIAVMRISGNFRRNDFVHPIRLPKMWQRTIGDGLASGWGRWHWWPGGFRSDDLRIVHVPILPDSACRHSRPFERVRIYDSMLCTGYENSELRGGPCEGDYGGPLKAENGGYLAGIFSNAWHRGCNDKTNLPIFTKVSHYIDWIEICTLWV